VILPRYGHRRAGPNTDEKRLVLRASDAIALIRPRFAGTSSRGEGFARRMRGRTHSSHGGRKRISTLNSSSMDRRRPRHFVPSWPGSETYETVRLKTKRGSLRLSVANQSTSGEPGRSSGPTPFSVIVLSKRTRGSMIVIFRGPPLPRRLIFSPAREIFARLSILRSLARRAILFFPQEAPAAPWRTHRGQPWRETKISRA
jgi:hypothetical protein